MSRPDLVPFAEAERSDLADLLTELEPEEWAADTLCVGWTVRDVVAHVFSYDDLRLRTVAALAVRARLRGVQANDLALEPFRDDTTEQLLERVRARLTPRGLPAAFRGGIALADGMIHSQDIRRPLRRPRRIPEERIRPALDITVTAPTLGSRRRLRDLQLVADDLDWTYGRGWVVRGPAESLLMLAAGRATALAECRGPGVPRLRARMATG